MQFLAPDVVVLDPWAAVASEYSRAVPRRRDFSLPQPYQQPQQHVDGSRSTAEGASDSTAGPGAAPDDGGATAEPDSGAAAQQPTGGSAGVQRKKRTRSSGSSYQPNEREREAAARHATIAPQLAAAAAAVQAWLHASGAPTVQEALAAGSTATDNRQQPRDEPAGRAAEAPPHAAAAAAPAPTGSAGAAAAGAAAADAGLEPDYRAMFELRHNLKPKLELLGPVPAGAAGQGGPQEWAGGRQRPQDVQQPAANLFNRMLCSECCPAEGCTCASASGCTTASGGDGGCERLAVAGGHPVLLPPRSRFLMSDARQLAPLVEDAEGATVHTTPAVCLMCPVLV